MLDNDEPWKPPELQKLTEAPRLMAQVPELTIISTERKQPSTRNNNFLQRAALTEKSFKPQVISSVNPKSPIDTRFNNNVFPHAATFQKSPVTNVPKEDNRGYPPILTRPSVPDVTILDDNKETNRKSTEKVFTNSYKEMLINSHDQFLKQLSSESSPTGSNSQQQQVPLSRFKQNPLSKYIPSPQEQPKIFSSTNNFKDLNSSSILSDIDITQNNNNNNKKQENEEVTFKKVADMLSEIQKLVIAEKSPSAQSPNSSAGSSEQLAHPKKSNQCQVLRQLANSFLTSEELSRYKVDNELNEIENYVNF